MPTFSDVETKSIRSTGPAAHPSGPHGIAVPSHGAHGAHGLSGGLATAARRLWRQIILAVSFVEFGAAALAVAFVFAPLERLRAASAEEAELAVQRTIRRAYAFSVACWKQLGVFTFDARPLAALASEPACIVVANHPTLIDVVLIGSQLEQMDCIVNAGWTAHSPFLARGIDAAGYVRNDGGVSVVEACATRLRRGRKLLVFPEGTRSPWGSFGKFHRGAAHISLASGAPVVAVSIRCRPRMLGSKRKWYDTDPRRPDYELRIAGRLDPSAYAGMTTPLAARRMTEDLLSIFLQEPKLADA